MFLLQKQSLPRKKKTLSVSSIMIKSLLLILMLTFLLKTQNTKTLIFPNYELTENIKHFLINPKTEDLNLIQVLILSLSLLLQKKDIILNFILILQKQNILLLIFLQRLLENLLHIEILIQNMGII